MGTNPPNADAASASVDADVSLLNQSLNQLDAVTSSLCSLAAAAAWSARGYFDAAQHDAIEHLFFRFLVARGILVSLSSQESELLPRTGDGDADASDDEDHVQRALARAEDLFAHDGISEDINALRTMIILAAGIALYVYEGKFIQCFWKDKIAVSKLNEQFYRSDIQRDTFDRLRLECTDATANGRVKSLAGAYHEYQQSDAHAVCKEHAKADELSQLIDSLVKGADTLAQELVGQPDLMLPPSLKNRVQHARLATHAREAKSDTKQILRKARACTFKGVSRLKSPRAHLITFSAQQKRDVLGMVRPGDMILTFTAGYMSDVFIPGAFKHGITYVGSPSEREDAGLNADAVARIQDELPEGKAATLLEQFKIATVQIQDKGGSSTMDADVIEAVAEGVIFNNLAHVMDTHINRLLILRPNITSEERVAALLSVFRFLGDSYDFGFNFGDVSSVVCTEVQYHAFNGKGGLAFELTKRAGHPTLSADDIVNYYLTHPESFDFVLLALEDTESSCHEAKVHVGDAGKGVLTDLMASESK